MSDADADRLIARWAASHARELIAEAQAEALVVARERLRARLVEGLLDAADERLTAEPRRPPAPAPDRAAGASESVLWVYGVVPAGAAVPEADGVDGHPVEVHRRAALGALVSAVPKDAFTPEALRSRLEDLESLETLARAHDLVLERAVTNGAVVPFRLCTIYSSQALLDEMLDRQGGTLRASLDRLDGMQEWGVKAFLRDTVAAAADAPDAASGTDYLTRKRERRDAAVAGREATEAAVAEIHARLTERAAASALSRPQDRRLSGRQAEMVLNAAYLVPADGAAAFRAIVDELGRRHEPEAVELELTGPWPPYHFVDPPADDRDA